MFTVPEVRNVIRPAEKLTYRTVKTRDGDYIEINPDIITSESHRDYQSKFAPYLNKVAKIDDSIYKKSNARSSNNLTGLVYNSSQASINDEEPKRSK